MQVIETFVGNNYSIQFMISDIKENMHYLPTEQLNRFDIIQIVCHANDKTTVLFEDVLQAALAPFFEQLKLLRNGLLYIDTTAAGELGKACDEALARRENSKEIKQLWKFLIWEYGNTSSYIYQKNEEHYLEIAQSYLWHFADPEENKSYIKFDDYIKDYKPYIVKKVDAHTVECWIKQWPTPY